MTNLFNRNSYWDQEQFPVTTERSWKVTASEPELMPEEKPITNQQLEDWSHRLQTMADEASDEKLLALASDLLDLRDEIVFELHSRIG